MSKSDMVAEPLRTNLKEAADFPLPEDFGLPSEFSISVYETEKKRFEDRVSRISAWYTFAAFVATQLFLYFTYRTLEWNTTLVLYTAFPPFCFPLIAGLNWSVKIMVRKTYLHKLIESDLLEAAYFELAQPYLDALLKWAYFQTEAGFGYWRDLKGIEFERAVADFFRRRDGTAQLTKSSGDGGVDIVLKLGSSTYWCQCKGYSKPVAVAAIRQIAGTTMKSEGSAIPVMFSTNGYTKPALVEAATLGVICIDGLKLSQLAKHRSIAALI